VRMSAMKPNMLGGRVTVLQVFVLLRAQGSGLSEC